MVTMYSTGFSGAIHLTHIIILLRYNKKERVKMAIFSIISCFITIIFLSYAHYVLKTQKPKVKGAIKVFLVFTEIASIISMSFAGFYLIKCDTQYALPLSCIAMAFALPVFIIIEQLREKD